MKYIVMLGDGMADYPVEALGGKTPLEVAKKPMMDMLAKYGKLGLVKTVPDGMKPGSDVANLSAMGYDPLKCYTGRSPLEAISMGIEMNDTDVAFRCNVVTLSDEVNYEDKTMVDYSSDEISSEEAKELILAVQEGLGDEIRTFFPGISYRHCMIWKEGPVGLDLIPPHDISDKPVQGHLPKDEIILDLMKKSYDILKNHPINIARKERGLNPGNSIWLWGEGTKPQIGNFKELYKKHGAVISAVDLLKGIGIGAGMDVIEVEGATGTVETNFDGKAEAAIKTLLEDGNDFVYIHVEAADECGHHGDVEGKVRSIELIDEKILVPLLGALNDADENYRILLLPDHPTPLALKTHVSDPVPYVLFDSKKMTESGIETYTEETAKSTGVYFEKGYMLLKKLL